MSRPSTVEIQSIRDGKASIEHQIDIHESRQLLSLANVLDGLQYVMNYRLKGGRLPNLDFEIMKRLCEGLLLNMSYMEGGLLKRKMTLEANRAFILFGEFMEEVEEFRQAVREKNVSDLYHALKLHRRCKDVDPAVKQSVFSDWRELVKDEEQGDVEKLIKEFTDVIKKPRMPSLHGVALPPPLLKMFRTSLTDGLPATEIPVLLKHYGSNQLPKPPKTSILSMLLNQLKDFMVLILIAAAIVTAALGDFKDMGVLLFVIVLNTIIGFTQEYKATKALEALQKLSVPKAQVVRDGQQMIIDSSQLVPGDIVVLEEGDAVPADVRIVECSNLEVIESILTGESLPVSKNTKKIWTATRHHPLGDCKGNAFMSTTIARGRVAVTTVTMAIGVRRMAKRSAIVRTLPAVETLGSVTVICSDKTGTLTEGKMGPIELWTANDSLYTFTKPTSMDPNEGDILFLSAKHNQKGFELHDDSIQSQKSDKMVYKSLNPKEVPRNPQNVPPHLMTALMVSCLCNNSSVIQENDGEWKGVGDPTEVALLLAAQKGGLPKGYWEKDCGFVKIHEKAFDSERKIMSVVYKIEDSTLLGHSKPTKLVLVKGAPEELLRKCTHHLPEVESTEIDLPFDIIFGQKERCQPKELSDNFIDIVSDQTFKIVYDDISSSSRISHDSEKSQDTPTVNPLFDETDLTFVGLIGLIDPPKKAVKESIRKCKEAGIQVIMITGDHIATATAIAKDIGIIEPGDPNTFDLLSEQAIKELNPFPSVFARVSPDNKLKIVQALQSLENSVAMTGDGVNDAPAIKASDIGIAMGVSGTEITKQAADIVLANDDFSTIVIAVEEGRQVFDNILKFIVYLLTDVPPAMSLGIEPAEGDLMRRKPRDPNSGVLNIYTTSILLMQASVMALATFGVYKIGLSIEHMDLKDAQSLAFVTSCLKDSSIIIGIEMLKPEFSQNPSTAFSTTPSSFNNTTNQIFPSKIKAIWTEELHNPTTADVRFVIGDHELFASSSILAKRSKYFKDIFDEMKRDTKCEINENFGIREKEKSGIGESDEKLSIPDDEESWSFDDTLSIVSTTSSNETVFTSSSKPSSFKSRDFCYELVISDFPYHSVLQLLQFLYTDDLPFTDKVSSFPFSDEIYSLYGIADKYQILDLKSHLKKLILCNLKLETCAEMLFKHVWKWPELKRVVMPFVVKYFAKIKCTQGYLNIVEKCKCGEGENEFPTFYELNFEILMATFSCSC
ncbi:18315_t:CDS:10 [Racocetra fulgida]|uniref:18315_t:CDS:1 n=1 Tax=Racocetra fulgida TaxID=60492 RepID=A0A9N9A117_9GLOM|nr:18315_t:CDS:10 [Racocetra fulgida]